MQIVVNGEPLPRELIREQERALAQLPEWRDVPDSFAKNMRLREAAERSAIDRVLLRQATDRDPRPIDPAIVAAEVARLKETNGCRVVFDDRHLSREIEGQMRLQRTLRDLMGPVAPPTDAEIARFYKARRKDFARPETLQAAHIVKNVDETHPEDAARAGIETALAELQRGEPFADVAERHSDCNGNGGDLGWFPLGEMVEEFDAVVFNVRPGERSPIFRTAFGFHIAEVRGRKPAGIAELREVKETIAGYLMAMLEQEAQGRAMEKLRTGAEIRRVSARRESA
jgi:hypothetical protein